jgi:hypothetical protein
MSSDQTPDMPDTRWSPTEGLCTRTEDDEYGVQWWPLLPYRPGGTGPLPSEPPADAVRLVSESPFATDPQIRLEVALSAAHEGMRKQAAEIERLKAELERLARWEETGSLTIQRLNAELAELSARFGLSEDRGDNRCPSCEHRISMHGDEGCVQEIDHGPGDEPCCCPCAVEVDGTAQARDQAGTGDTAQPGGDVIEQRAAEVVQEAIWPALRDQVDESWTYSEVRNLLTTKAVDALAANLLLATHPEGPTARRDPLTRELNSKIVHAYTSKTHKPGIPSTLIRALIEEGVFARPEPEPARPDTPTEPGGVLEDGGDGPTDVGDTDSQGAGQC